MANIKGKKTKKINALLRFIIHVILIYHLGMFNKSIQIIDNNFIYQESKILSIAMDAIMSYLFQLMKLEPLLKWISKLSLSVNVRDNSVLYVDRGSCSRVLLFTFMSKGILSGPLRQLSSQVVLTHQNINWYYLNFENC